MGRRVQESARRVINDTLERGLSCGLPLITTDGFRCYPGVIGRLLGLCCVHGQVIKIRRNDDQVQPYVAEDSEQKTDANILDEEEEDVELDFKTKPITTSAPMPSSKIVSSFLRAMNRASLERATLSTLRVL